MSWSLIDGRGRRKYLTAAEREAFICAAATMDMETRLFCLTLALCGARISEVLLLRADQVDVGTNSVVIETLKRRKRGLFRTIPLPEPLVVELAALSGQSHQSTRRLWPWCRTTAWRRIKTVMVAARIPPELSTPRALRHSFGVCASQQKIVMSLIQKWLGHAKIETTAIYATPIGDEERALAALTWSCVEVSNGVRMPVGAAK